MWGFGVLFLSCACVSMSGVLFSVDVCVCDLLIGLPQGGISTHPQQTARSVSIWHETHDHNNNKRGDRAWPAAVHTRTKQTTTKTTPAQNRLPQKHKRGDGTRRDTEQQGPRAEGSGWASRVVWLLWFGAAHLCKNTHLGVSKKRNRSHTQTHNKKHTTHDKNNTRTTQHTTRQEQHHKRPHGEPPRPHLATIEGCAATVRTTSHTWVSGRTEVSVGGRVEIRRALGWLG